MIKLFPDRYYGKRIMLQFRVLTRAEESTGPSNLSGSIRIWTQKFSPQSRSVGYLLCVLIKVFMRFKKQTTLCIPLSSSYILYYSLHNILK
jgi:hypothetical protein